METGSRRQRAKRESWSRSSASVLLELGALDSPPLRVLPAGIVDNRKLEKATFHERGTGGQERPVGQVPEDFAFGRGDVGGGIRPCGGPRVGAIADRSHQGSV